jgi:rubrerythrin
VDIIKALEMLKKLELTVQKLYLFYNTFFLDKDEEAASFFYEISTEEKSHADLIDYELRTIKKNKSLFNDVEFDITPLNDLIAEIESHISSKEPVSLEDILNYAIELESNALELHYRTLIAKSNLEIGELIKKLGAEDEKHYNNLKQFAIKRGYLDQ